MSTTTAPFTVNLVQQHDHDDETIVFVLAINGQPATLIATASASDTLVYDGQAVDLLVESMTEHELARAVYAAVDPDAA